MLFQNLKAIGDELSEICVLFCKYIYIFIYIDVQLPKKEYIKYLGLHLDRRLTWNTHLRKMETTRTHPHWNLLVTQTQVKRSTSNKLLIYKTILKSIWTYGIQLWGTASTSNIEILEHFQSKALRMIIRRYSSQYSARLSSHTNDLIVNLIELPDNRRLRRHLPNDSPIRFLV
jgi:hypothetical protein